MNNSDTSHYENVPFEVPEGWEWCRYEEYIDVRDGTHDSPKYLDSGYPFVTSKNLRNGEIDFSNVRYISEEDHLNFCKRSCVEDGDILFAMIGSIGNPVLVRKDREFSIKNVALFKPYCRNVTNMEWVLYYLQYVQEQLKDNAKGGMQPFITLNYFRKELLIPIPPHVEQIRIINELKNWIKHISVLDTETEFAINIIDTIKLRVLNIAINGKLIPQDKTDEPAIELLKRINPQYQPADNRHYENLPQNWEECALKDIVEIQNGYAFKSSLYSNDGVRVIRITNVQDGYIMDDSPKYYPLSHMDGLEDYMLKGNDLLMSLTGNVGRVAMMPAGLLPAALNQRVCCITPKSSEVCKEFLFYLLRTDSFITSCIESGKGVAQLNVSTEWLKSYRIALPPKDEQRRIVKAIQNIMTKIDKILADL